MDATAIRLGLSIIGVSVLMILVSLPALKGKIPMNRWYGARFKKSFLSEENWYKINAYSAKHLIIWSLPLMIIGIVTLFLPLEDHPQLSNALLFTFLLILVPLLLSYRYAQRI